MKSYSQIVQTVLICLDIFQTEKYFKHIEDEIRNDFSFDQELLETCKGFIEDDTISLHIRRGDYVVNPNHPTQTMEYYEQFANFQNFQSLYSLMILIGVKNRNYLMMIDS